MFAKQFAVAALVANVSAEEVQRASITPDAYTVEQIISGFLEGAVKAENLDNLDTCITQGSTVVSDVELLITDLKSRNILKKIKGIKMLGTAVKDLIFAIKDCKASAADIAKLEHMAALLLNPKSVLVNAFKNFELYGVDIKNEISASITDYS